MEKLYICALMVVLGFQKNLDGTVMVLGHDVRGTVRKFLTFSCFKECFLGEQGPSSWVAAWEEGEGVSS